MKGFLIIVIMLFVGTEVSYSITTPGGGAGERKVSTTLKSPVKPKRKKLAETDEIFVRPTSEDSLEWSRKIVFAGFDKQASSLEESFFITNNSDDFLKAVQIKITYFDSERRMLHQRVETIKADIPAGQTRKIDIKSFDKQRSFYHTLSNRPKKRATPFDTRIEIISIKLKK